MSKYDSGDLVGKTVTTGERNQTCNEGMKPSTITLPIKQYSFEGVTSGMRDTPLDAGGMVKTTS